VVARALEATTLPGRAELLAGRPSVLLDGAHTPVSIAQVIRTAELLEPRPSHRAIVFGAVRDKAHREMLQAIATGFSRVVIARPGEFKPSDLDELTRIAGELGLEAIRADETADAIERACALAGPEGLIVVTGSFYLVGRARTLLRERPEAGDGYESNPV
jgi:dihydrofolate synthase/folylpolyglutamate synthase